MKFTTQIILAASVLCLAACTENKDADKTSAGVGTTPVNFSNPGTQTQTGATTGVNPAHGQPGHRCDIPVGADLGSPAQSNTATPPPITTPVTTGTVAAGTNPAHGQPGHDCSVAVGAPLPQ
jgi:hypothetical protein